MGNLFALFFGMDFFREYNQSNVVHLPPITKEGTMEENNQAEFQIKVSATDATDEELDRVTRQLLSELRELNVESAELTKGGLAPQGTKAIDPVLMGNIAIAVLPAVLPNVISLVQAWATRGQGRTVKFKGKVGKDLIEFEGPPEELQKLLESLDKGKKKK